MSDKTLQVQVKLSADGLVQGLKGSSKAVSDFVENYKAQFKSTAPATKEASEGVSSLSKTLREFKTEATANGRVARFLANDLVEIIPGANGAAGALKSLLAIGLGGAGVFGGIELGVFLLGKLNEALTEDKKLAQEVNDAQRDSGRQTKQALEGVERSLHPVTATQAAWGAQVRRVREENTKLQDEINKLLPKVGGVGDAFIAAANGVIDASAATGGFGVLVKEVLGRTQAVRDTMSEIKQLQATIAANEAGLESQKPTKVEVGSKENEKVVHDARLRLATESQKQEVERHARLRALSVEDASEIEKTEADLQTKIEKLREEASDATRANKLNNEKEADKEVQALNNAALAARIKGINVEIAAEQIRARQRIANLKIEQRAVTENDAAATAQGKYAEQEKGYAALAELRERDGALALAQNDEELAARLTSITREADQEAAKANEARQANLISEKDFQAELARIRKTVSDKTSKAIADAHKKDFESAKEFGNSLGSALAEVAMHAKSAGDAMKAMASQALSAIEPLILATIGKVAADAAGSVAGTPFVGPVLAVGAAATVFGALQSLLHSAAGGFDIAGGVNPITQLHAREMVLPAHIATPLRESISSGRLGGLPASSVGGGAEIHIHAADAAGFDRVVRNNVGTLIRAAQRVQRNGRRR